MKRLMILGLVYIIGGISGVILDSVTYGAADRGRIMVLESELKSRNDKLDKCTDALINSSHPAAPATATSPK
jgi:tetrahydromethanopterin S-methyltransferase subunit B